MMTNATQSHAGTPKEYFLPAVDAFETQDDLILIADMPGVDSGGLEVTVAEGVLTLSGKVASREEAGMETVQQEFLSGDYYRQFQIPRDFVADRVDASLKSGVVTIRIPRAERAKPKRIPVRSE